MGVFYIGLGVLWSSPLLAALFVIFVRIKLFGYYVPRIARIFQEKPLFIVPRGQPREDAEVVHFRTSDGLTLRACYFKGQGERRGVILFGLEFGSDCWSCWSYCERLVAGGFDVFAYEPRNQGQSEAMPGYEPLQWVTDYEVKDAEAALAYLKKRPDADPHGVGLFGVSKGAGAGVLAAAEDPFVRCVVTDGMFATATTLYPYMKHWFTIYNKYFPPVLIADWVLRGTARRAMRRVERERGCRFPYLEKAMPRLAPRPILMIHGGQDAYIKPEMARAVYEMAGEPKEFWLVKKAKHNQALATAGEEYQQRVLRFFEAYLAEDAAGPFEEATRQDASYCEPALGQ